MADRAREDFARCVSRKLGESQSKDVRTDALQSGWHSKCWRGASLHSWMFASALVRFAGSCLTVRPRNPRQACLPLSVDGLSFRSRRRQPEHVCWDCCLYHLRRERFLVPSHSKTITKGTTLERKNTPMQLIDSVTRARFSVRSILHAFFLLTLLFQSFTHVQTSLLLEMVERLSALFVICRCDVVVFSCSSLVVLSTRRKSMSKAPHNLDLGDFADDASEELIGEESYAQEESLAESSKRKLMGHSRRSAGGGADLFCWLCDAPMVVGQASNKWYDRELHNRCFTAVRCHKQLLENDEKEWTSMVRGLVADNELRSEAARRAARAQIKNRETCIDSGQVEDDLLLTKRRFISYVGFWEGYGSDTASESFDRRLQCSDSDHENERSEKQISPEDNVRIRKVTGKRTTTAGTKSSRRGRDREAPEESGRSCKQGRDRGRRRDRGQDVPDGDHKSCDRRERDRTGGDERGPLFCRGSSRNRLGGGESSKQHGELLPSPGTRSIGKPVKKREQFSSPEECGGIPTKKTAMDFMVAKKML